MNKQNTKEVTFRTNNGKAHPGILSDGYLLACCRCPGSQNGRLTKGAIIISEGHQRATCRV